MPGIPKDGGKRLSHRVVDITMADGVSVVLEANPARLRVLMFNSTAMGTGSIIYVGDRVCAAGAALAAANGWPLNETEEAGANGWKLGANVLELFTKDTVYGLATVADGHIKMIEELLA